MEEATLCQALNLDLPSPTSPDRLAALAQAMTEITDELDGLSSRLALVTRAMAELHHLRQNRKAAAARLLTQLGRDEARAQMNTRERLQDSATDEDTDALVDEAIQEEAGAPARDRCVNCNSLLPARGVKGWLCAPCELVLDPDVHAGYNYRTQKWVEPLEGASVASAGAAGPSPLDSSEVTP